MKMVHILLLQEESIIYEYAVVAARNLSKENEYMNSAKKKIAVLTGAGVSAESGLSTEATMAFGVNMIPRRSRRSRGGTATGSWS